MFEVVVDFSSNLLTASTEDAEFISSVTPNNFLAVIDFLRDSNALVLPDFSDEVDYSALEY